MGAWAPGKGWGGRKPLVRPQGCSLQSWAHRCGPSAVLCRVGSAPGPGAGTSMQASAPARATRSPCLPLFCSGAMGLPVSGFPNMNAVSLEDATGQTFVNTADFLAVGVPSSVLAYGVIVSLGYALMKAIGF